MTEEQKTEEPKDVRLPFMVTASEAKAIDDWRYAKRVPSRAETMRLLLQIGLSAEKILALSNNFMKTYNEVVQDLGHDHPAVLKLRSPLDELIQEIVYSSSKGTRYALEEHLKKLSQKE